MKVCHTLLCFIFFILQDGNTGFVSAGVPVYKGKEGGTITVKCTFPYSGTKKLFCKKNCEKGNILIDTTKDTAENDRYSIKYVKKGIWSSDYLNVSIKQLKKSDTGWYRCHLTNTWKGNLDQEFYIDVTEATTTTTTTTTTTATTTQSLNFSSGNSTVSSASTETSKESLPAGSDLMLYVGVILSVMIILLSAALLIFCKKKRATNPKESPVETEYANITDPSRLYEEIKEGGGLNSSPLVEMSSLYTYATASQVDVIDNTDLYSLATSPENKIVLHENHPPVSTCEDSTYQNCISASRVPDQTYSTIIKT